MQIKAVPRPFPPPTPPLPPFFINSLGEGGGGRGVGKVDRINDKKDYRISLESKAWKETKGTRWKD